MDKSEKITIGVIVTGVLLLCLFLLNLLQNFKEEQHRLIEENIFQEAKAHFRIIVYTRRWNASHGGVYIKEHDGLQPNPYLLDNQLKTDTNETLIKINPAWMTRQISELANRDSSYQYNITALDPVNPHNIANAFEQEALRYFQNHPNDDYYVKHTDDLSGYNFMGNLRVEASCLNCHTNYNMNDVGSSRGGIRITIPLQHYQESFSALQRIYGWMGLLVIIASILSVIVLVYMTRLFFKGRQATEAMNRKLETEVLMRTAELRELNESLENLVREEVEKNRQKDSMMLGQYRHAAMNEMAAMIAHQWRQPLASISMAVSNLTADIELDLLTPEMLQNQLQMITEKTQELSNTIDLFRDTLSSTASDDRQTLGELLSVIELMLNERLEEHGIAWSAALQNCQDLPVPTEVIHLVLIFINNAIDAFESSKTSGRRYLKLSAACEDAMITLRFEDNAGGIDPEKLPYIFDPYHTSKNDFDGAGLGLFIAKTMIEKELHGTISIENSASKDGVMITLKVPRESDSE